MRDSIFTVITPAATHDLTTLETVKDELGILNTAQDTRLYRWIAEASGFIKSYCNRTFAEEQVSELWRSAGGMGRFHHHHHGDGQTTVGFLQLRRFPVTTIDSVSEDDGTALTSDDYEIDAERGWLWRMSSRPSNTVRRRAAVIRTLKCRKSLASWFSNGGCRARMKTACRRRSRRCWIRTGS